MAKNELDITTLTPEQRHELIRNANEEAQWLIRIACPFSSARINPFRQVSRTTPRAPSRTS